MLKTRGAGVTPAPHGIRFGMRSAFDPVRIDGQVTVHVVPGFAIVVAPAVRPDPGRARRPLARTQNDAEGFVVQQQR